MLRWLGQYALDLGLTKVYLDSRNTARGFYEKVGFTFSTSIPCAMDAAELAGDSFVIYDSLCGLGPNHHG